jgi:glycosyltransferase involved in cell wall biosynthesis
MDIAVCGAQVPFTRGGAELHMENLCVALTTAGHRAELVRLPTAWDKDRVFDSALAWRLVPLDVDLVIATNFPSYFVRHPNKVVWLFHQHRGFYDGADSAWSDVGLDEASLEAQRLMAEWDAAALTEARHVFSTSGVVAARLARYCGLAAEPLYHPPPLHDRLHPGPFGDYVFCASRLERNKRPDLFVGALAHLRSPVRVSIAGTGTMADDLVAMAGPRADRLELLGFVDDEVLLSLYAGALGVVYVPFDEDYGYVTLQAFLAGKPVITTTDAGGVLEWVEDGVTGFVVEPTTLALADAIDRLAADPDAARAMGDKGRDRASSLDWDAVVRQLLGAGGTDDSR